MSCLMRLSFIIPILISWIASVSANQSQINPFLWPGTQNCPPEPDLTEKSFPDSKWTPSGASLHPSRGTVFIVDFNGGIQEIDHKGRQLKHWNVPQRPSKVPLGLQAIAFVPGRDKYAYLGLERPGAIAEFSLKTSKITRVWYVQRILDISDPGVEPRGMSSLAYLPTPRARTGGFWYFGGKQYGAVFIAELELDAKKHDPDSAIYVAKVYMPGLSYDLSGLSVAYYNIWMAFSNPAMIFRIDLRKISHADFKRVVPETVKNPKLPFNLDARQVETFKFRFLSIKGIQGIAFAQNPKDAGKQYAYLHIFHPQDWQGPEVKALYRFTSKTLAECFESLG